MWLYPSRTSLSSRWVCIWPSARSATPPRARRTSHEPAVTRGSFRSVTHNASYFSGFDNILMNFEPLILIGVMHKNIYYCFGCIKWRHHQFVFFTYWFVYKTNLTADLWVHQSFLCCVWPDTGLQGEMDWTCRYFIIGHRNNAGLYLLEA